MVPDIDLYFLVRLVRLMLNSTRLPTLERTGRVSPIDLYFSFFLNSGKV